MIMPRTHLISIDDKDIKKGGFISVSNAAKYLNISPRTLHDWIAAGHLPALQNSQTRTIRLKVSVFLDWVDIHFNSTQTGRRHGAA